MSASIQVASCMVDQTITANGTTASFPLNANFSNAFAEISIGANPTGTSPTLTFQLQLSFDGGVTWENFGSPTADLNSVGVVALSNSNCIAPLARLSYTVGGTTPSFTQVSVAVYQN